MLPVTIGPRQAIAVHIGARGKQLPYYREAARHVSVLFYETATITLGEVSAHQFRVPTALTFTINHVVEHLRRGQRAATRELGSVQCGTCARGF
jgi:hypothetical protein